MPSLDRHTVVRVARAPRGYVPKSVDERLSDLAASTDRRINKLMVHIEGLQRLVKQLQRADRDR